MRRAPRPAWHGALALALAASGCAPACDPAPEAAAGPAPAGTAVAGEVAVLGDDRRALDLGPVEVRFVAEAAMRPFVQARLAEALAELERLSREGERLRGEVERLRAENDRLNQRWRSNMDRDLRRRLELQVRRDLSAGEVRSAQAALVRTKRELWAEAQDAARRADVAERQWLALRGTAPGLRDGAWFLAGLPPAELSVTTDAGGRFQARLPAGRYAVVASAARPRPRGGAYAWLLWTDVGAGPAERLSLTEANLHGTDCPACVVAVGGLPR